jgi:hypothetical protein
MNSEGCGRSSRGLIRGTIPTLPRQKPRENLIKAAGIPVEILTGDLQI